MTYGESRITYGVRWTIVSGCGQDFGDVDHPLRLALAVQTAVDIGQAASVAGDHQRRAAGLDIGNLARQHGVGDLGVLDGKHAAETAAFVGVGQVHDLGPLHCR